MFIVPCKKDKVMSGEMPTTAETVQPTKILVHRMKYCCESSQLPMFCLAMGVLWRQKLI